MIIIIQMSAYNISIEHRTKKRKNGDEENFKLKADWQIMDKTLAQKAHSKFKGFFPFVWHGLHPNVSNMPIVFIVVL